MLPDMGKKPAKSYKCYQNKLFYIARPVICLNKVLLLANFSAVS